MNEDLILITGIAILFVVWLWVKEQERKDD